MFFSIKSTKVEPTTMPEHPLFAINLASSGFFIPKPETTGVFVNDFIL